MIIAPLGKSYHVGLVWTFITFSAIEYMVGKDVITGNIHVKSPAFARRLLEIHQIS